MAKNLFKAENVIVFSSNSGKLTSEFVRKWFHEAFLPNSWRNSLLLLDSWSGQNTETSSSSEILPDILTIPPGTTGIVQPLDVFFFRSWKNFHKKFSDIVMIYRLDMNLHARKNIIQLQSQIHNQFSSPRFLNLINYAWFKSGYID